MTACSYDRFFYGQSPHFVRGGLSKVPAIAFIVLQQLLYVQLLQNNTFGAFPIPIAELNYEDDRLLPPEHLQHDRAEVLHPDSTAAEHTFQPVPCQR